MGVFEKRNDIVDEYLRILEADDQHEISVSLLAHCMNMNRKTFYYYFKDIESMHVWIFRRDLARILESNYTKPNLVFEDDKDSVFSPFPYYARLHVGEGLMNQASFFMDLATCLSSRKALYAKMLADNRRGGFVDYIHRLYQKAIAEDARYILSDRNVSETAIEFISDWITGAFLARIVTMVLRRANPLTMDKIAPFSNIQHEILYMYSTFDYDSESDRLALPDRTWLREESAKKNQKARQVKGSGQGAPSEAGKS